MFGQKNKMQENAQETQEKGIITLPILKKDGRLWVMVKPICTWLCLDYAEQVDKIREHDVLSDHTTCAPSPTQTMKPFQEGDGTFLCLALDYFQGWLFTLSDDEAVGVLDNKDYDPNLLIQMQNLITPRFITAMIDEVKNHPMQIDEVREIPPVADAAPDDEDEDEDEDEDWDDDEDWAKEFAEDDKDDDFDFDLDDPNHAKGLVFALFRGNHSQEYEILEYRLRDYLDVDRLEAGVILRGLIGKGYIVRGLYDDADRLVGKKAEKIYRLAQALELMDKEPVVLTINGHEHPVTNP